MRVVLYLDVEIVAVETSKKIQVDLASAGLIVNEPVGTQAEVDMAGF